MIFLIGLMTINKYILTIIVVSILQTQYNKLNAICLANEQRHIKHEKGIKFKQK